MKITGTNSGLISQITSRNQLSVTYMFTLVLVMKITSQNDFFSLHKPMNNEWNTERSRKKKPRKQKGSTRKEVEEEEEKEEEEAAATEDGQRNEERVQII